MAPASVQTLGRLPPADALTGQPIKKIKLVWAFKNQKFTCKEANLPNAGSLLEM
jgi:hypothetical protein